MKFEDLNEHYKKFTSEKEFNALLKAFESNFRMLEPHEGKIIYFRRMLERSLSRLEILEILFERTNDPEKKRGYALKIINNSIICSLSSLIIHEELLPLLDNVIQVHSQRKTIRKNIVPTNTLVELKKKKPLLKNQFKFFLAESKEQVKNLFQMKFEIDALEQRYYKDIVSISEHEKIRAEQFTQIENESLTSLKQFFEQYQLIYNWRAKELDHISKNEYPLLDKTKRPDYITFLQYKYKVEALELWLEKKLHLTYEQRQFFILAAENASKEEIQRRCLLLKEIISNENYQRIYSDEGHKENHYKPDKDLYGLTPEAFIEVYFIYKFIDYKKTLQYNCNNNQNTTSTSTIKNRPHFLKNDVKNSNDQKARKLIQDAFALRTQFKNNPTDSNAKETCMQKLQEAAQIGSTEAKNLYELWFKQEQTTKLMLN